MKLAVGVDGNGGGGLHFIALNLNCMLLSWHSRILSGEMIHGALSAHISVIWELSCRTAFVSVGNVEMKYEPGS